MGEGIPALEQAYEGLFVLALCVLALFLVLGLIRAIIGPRVSDRIVAVNMMGTLILAIIAILAVMLEEGYLVDICLIYAMMSFLAVIVLCKVYMGVYRQQKEEKRALGQTRQEEEKADGDN
jgi:multicomponent Na+:H+ antiporter subunit F